MYGFKLSLSAREKISFHGMNLAILVGLLRLHLKTAEQQ
jgi:hypothetical protein